MDRLVEAARAWRAYDVGAEVRIERAGSEPYSTECEGWTRHGSFASRVRR